MAFKLHLDAREYKLLLRAEKLGGDHDVATARSFWERHMRPVVIGWAGSEKRASLAIDGKLDLDKDRLVVFSDTREGILGANGFSLRWRGSQESKDGEKRKRETTLKLRTADLYVAAAMDLPGAKASAEQKLEEDIAPLAIMPGPDRAKREACFADPPGTRSRFSRSTRQKADLPCSIGAVRALYPTLGVSIESLGGIVPGDDETLIEGPEVHEIVYEGITVDIGDAPAAEFALTFWRIGKGARQRNVAEISFKCDLTQGDMPPEPAQRAYDLFVAMQTGMRDIVERSELSKTALAIPVRKGAP